MYVIRRNFRVCYEIWVEEHDRDVNFRPEVEIGPVAVLHTCNERYAI